MTGDRSDDDDPTYLQLPETDIGPDLGETGRIGPYRPLEKLGEGGMGEVWLAEQTEPVKRRVALKIIKQGMDTKEVVARFEAERQALAMMDHPVIAKVYEAGATPHGRPYFAMEHIQGVPITEHCDRYRLTNRERLDLFMRVCEGVQHAHHKAVIHRDLKPSNVLVAIRDGESVPKIIDFGVAKATAQKLTDKTMHTQIGVMIGTPEYMSPEQAERTAQDVDTRTDVYSLGVILYQLLVGELPFDPGARDPVAFDEMLRRIRQDPPSKPSTRVSALENASAGSNRRRTDLPTWRRQLRGDLDWITMKALEKDRTRRYASPNELAQDIQRHLDDHPVLACPPSRVYRMSKFLQRHKVGVAAGTVVLLALLAGLAGTAFGLVRAQRAEGQARREAVTSDRVIELLVGLFEVSDPSEARGNEIRAREILDRAAQTLEWELDEQPAVRAALMGTVGRVYQNLGLNSEAKPLLEESLAIRRRLGEDHPDTLESMNDVCRHYQYVGQLDRADTYCRETMERTRRALGDDHPLTLLAADSMGSLLQDQGKLDEAEAYYREALDSRRRVLGADHEDTLVSLNNMGSLLSVQGRWEKAESYFRSALEGQRRVRGNDAPETLSAVSNLGSLYQEMDDLEEAERYIRMALEGRRRVLGIDHRKTLITMSNLGLLLQKRGRMEEAARYMNETIEGMRRTLGDDHQATLVAAHNLGYLLKVQGELEQAGPYFREATEGFSRTLGNEHWRTLNSMANLGDLYTDLGRYGEAEERLATAAEIAPVSLGRKKTTGLIIRKYGRCLTALKRYREAEIALLEAHAILLEVVGAEHSQTVRVVRNLGELYEAWGRPEKADSWRAQLPAES